MATAIIGLGAGSGGVPGVSILELSATLASVGWWLAAGTVLLVVLLAAGGNGRVRRARRWTALRSRVTDRAADAAALHLDVVRPGLSPSAGSA